MLQSKKRKDASKIPLKITIGDTVKKKKSKIQIRSCSSAYNSKDENISNNPGAKNRKLFSSSKSNQDYATNCISSNFSSVEDGNKKFSLSKQLNTHSLNKRSSSIRSHSSTPVSQKSFRASIKLDYNDISSLKNSRNSLKIPIKSNEDDISSMKESLVTLRTPIELQEDCKETVSCMSSNELRKVSTNSIHKKHLDTDSDDHSEIKSLDTYSSSLLTIESCKSQQAGTKCKTDIKKLCSSQIVNENLPSTNVDTKISFKRKHYDNHEEAYKECNIYPEMCDSQFRSQQYYAEKNNQVMDNSIQSSEVDNMAEMTKRDHKNEVCLTDWSKVDDSTNTDDCCSFSQQSQFDKFVPDLSILKEEIHSVNEELALLSNTIPLQKILLKYRALELKFSKSFRRIELIYVKSICKNGDQSESGIKDPKLNSATNEFDFNYQNPYASLENNANSSKRLRTNIYHDKYANLNSILSPMEKISDDFKTIVTPMNKTPLINNTTKEKGSFVLSHPNFKVSGDDAIKKFRRPDQKVALVKALKPLLLIPLRVCIFHNTPCSFWFS